MKEAAKLTLVWGFGYVGMWVMKWVMASLILGENVMPYVTEHIGERLYGDIGVSQLTYICGWHILMYMLPGLVPYIRYLVLHNHSYLHCFFTYRAQMATVLAIVLILEEVVDWRWLAHGRK